MIWTTPTPAPDWALFLDVDGTLLEFATDPAAVRPDRALLRTLDRLAGALGGAPALVTPVRDGMNLVAKEFVATRDGADPGVLVLSTLAGAAREMTSALLVNPYDSKAMAHAMQAAVNMPLTERRDRHLALLDVLRRNDIHAWHRRFLAALERPAPPPRRDARVDAGTRPH